jgi:hypothetical protein
VISEASRPGRGRCRVRVRGNLIGRTTRHVVAVAALQLSDHPWIVLPRPLPKNFQVQIPSLLFHHQLPRSRHSGSRTLRSWVTCMQHRPLLTSDLSITCPAELEHVTTGPHSPSFNPSRNSRRERPSSYDYYSACADVRAVMDGSPVRLG